MKNNKGLLIPPHSVEAEQSVLGSLLIAPDSWDKVSEILNKDDFYGYSHQLIYNAIIYLLSSNKPIDLITVSDRLEAINQLEDAGGFAYLGELAKNTPSAANVVAYAEAVKDRSISRQLISKANEIAERGYNPVGLTAKEQADLAEQGIMSIGDCMVTDKKDTSVEAGLVRTTDMLEEANKRNGIVGISTGLIDLDNKIGGLKKSNMIIVAARPSMGKTTLGLKFILTEALNNGYPLFFSMDMPENEIYNKLISNIGRIDCDKLENPSLMQDRHWAKISHAMEILKETNLSVIDRGDLSMLDINSEVRKYKKKHGRYPSLIMIDYIQLITSTNKENKTQKITDISMAIKVAAKEFNCPIVALSQLNRNVEQRSDKRPLNSDLRESGQLEQDANVIIHLYRDEVYDENSHNKGLAELIIGKNKMGSIGMVGSAFLGQYSAFENLDGRSFVQDAPKPYKKKW